MYYSVFFFINSTCMECSAKLIHTHCTCRCEENVKVTVCSNTCNNSYCTYSFHGDCAT